MTRARWTIALGLTLVLGCDPELNMSGPRPTRQTIEGCEPAVAHLRQCCPKYEAYLSCTVLDNGTPDLTEKQSRCVLERDCDAIAKAVTAHTALCGVVLPGKQCAGSP